MRLQVLVVIVYPETECGFHADRSTIDAIFSINQGSFFIFSSRQLQEKCREQRYSVATLCSQLTCTKVFDFVNRDALFKILPKIVCPLRLPNIIRSFLEDMKGTVSDVWWVKIRCLWHPKWSETGLSPSSHPVWYLLSFGAETCLSICHGRLLPLGFPGQMESSSTSPD